MRAAANDADGSAKSIKARTGIIFLIVGDYTTEAALLGGFCLRDAWRYCTGPNGDRYWFLASHVPLAKASGLHKQNNRLSGRLFCLLVAGAGIEPASGGSFTPAVSNRNGLYHNPIRTLPL